MGSLHAIVQQAIETSHLRLRRSSYLGMSFANLETSLQKTSVSLLFCESHIPKGFSRCLRATTISRSNKVVGTHLLPQPHNLEPLKIRKCTSLLPLFPFLRPRALIPLLLNTLLLPSLCNRTGTCCPWKFWDDDRCEDGVCERDGVPRDGGSSA